MTCSGTNPSPTALSPRLPVGPAPHSALPTHLSAPRLVSFASRRFPKRPDFTVVDIFIECALYALLRAMPQNVNNFSMSPHVPSPSRGPARCIALVRLAPSFGPVGNRVSHGTERNPAVPGPAAAGEPVHGLQEPLCAREAVPCPAPPALAVDRTGLRTGRRSRCCPCVSPRWGTAGAIPQPPIWFRGLG